MPVEIRPYAGDDLRAFMTAAEVPFAYDVSDDDVRDHERILERDRLVCAYDGDAIVGTAAALSFRLSVPGGRVPSAAITEVGVLPSHRRRGILTGMMARLLDDARRRAEPVAMLWASEAAIYPRFGYGLATFAGSFQAASSTTAFRDAPPPEGQARLVDGAEAPRLLPGVYEAADRPGFFERSQAWWEIESLADRASGRNGAGPTFTAVVEMGGPPEGYVRYRMRHAWAPGGHDNELQVRELMAATPRAERELWRFVFGMDLVARVRASLLPVDSPLLLLLAEPRRLGFSIGDGLFVRLVDLPAALSTRTYAGSGSLVLDVSDPTGPWNTGRWLLRADDAGGRSAPDDHVPAGSRGRVERTDRDADLALSVTELGSVYLGGVSFSALHRAGRIRELRTGAIRDADTLFSTDRAPWCPEIF